MMLDVDNAACFELWCSVGHSKLWVAVLACNLVT